MVEGHRREQWDHTAHLVATLCNQYATEGNRISPSDVHPFKDYYGDEPGQPAVEKVPFSMLKTVFFGG